MLLSLVAVIIAAHESPAEEEPARRPAHMSSLRGGLVFVRIPVAAAAKITRTRPGFDPNADLPLGSHILLLDRPDAAHSSGRLTNLTPGFAAAGRPDLSFDGKRILFVAKRTPNDRFHAWEMNIDGTGLRQITTESGPCSAAIYLSTIYTIDADQPVYQIAFCAGPDGSPSTDLPQGPRRPSARAAGSLFTCWMDGRRIRRITFNPFGVFDPYLLSDGRLLFSSWSVPDESGAAAPLGSSLFTVNTDGTDVFVFAGAHEPPARRGMPCETADGWVVYVESGETGWDRGGALVAVRRARSLRTRRLVATDEQGLYHSPSALPDGNLLVSYRRRRDDSYGVYVFDPRAGTRIAKIIDGAEWHEVGARAARPRAVPAGRSSVVDERFDTGFLYCMNVYLSDTDAGGRTAPGSVERLRVFRAVVESEDDRPDGGTVSDGVLQETTDAGRRPLVTEELLGEAPVEPDGSFYVEVPARTPLRLQTLDGEGAVVQAMKTWVWVMPREARGCIGCHEDRELTPPNRHTRALRQTPKPIGVVNRRAETAREHEASSDQRK